MIVEFRLKYPDGKFRAAVMLLETEMAAYRLAHGKIVEITSHTELKRLTHWLIRFSERASISTALDWFPISITKARKSIKESIPLSRVQQKKLPNCQKQRWKTQ